MVLKERHVVLCIGCVRQLHWPGPLNETSVPFARFSAQCPPLPLSICHFGSMTSHDSTDGCRICIIPRRPRTSASGRHLAANPQCQLRGLQRCVDQKPPNETGSGSSSPVGVTLAMKRGFPRPLSRANSLPCALRTIASCLDLKRVGFRTLSGRIQPPNAERPEPRVREVGRVNQKNDCGRRIDTA